MTLCPNSNASQATHRFRVYTRSASRKTRRNGRVRPQQKCHSTAGRSGAQARTTGMPASAEALAQLAASEAGTCNQAWEVNAAKCLAVATNTSASACGLGSGFSKANRIFTARSTSEPNHFLLYYLHLYQARSTDSLQSHSEGATGKVLLILRNMDI